MLLKAQYYCYHYCMHGSSQTIIIPYVVGLIFPSAYLTLLHYWAVWRRTR